MLKFFKGKDKGNLIYAPCKEAYAELGIILLMTR